MLRASTIWTNGTAGELSPRMSGLVDQSKYFNGWALLLNFLVLTQGPVMKCPGLQFIAEAKYFNKKARLIDFEFSSLQAYMLEFGDDYIRFFMDKGQIMGGGVPYEIVSPYAEVDLPTLWYVQSADTMYLTHPDYKPRKLTRTGHTAWTLNEIEFQDGPYLPQNLTDTTLTPSGTTGIITLKAIPALGAEKVNNGAFAVTLGPELISDGTFEASTAWIWGDGWAHDAVNKEADHTAGNFGSLRQLISIEAGKTYRLIYTMKNGTAGNITPRLGGTDATARTAPGTYTEDVVAGGDGYLKFLPTDASYDGAIDDVSCREVAASSAWTWGDHWSHDLINAEADHAAGASAALEQNIGAAAGKDYYLTFTVKNRTAGSVTPWIGGGSGAAVSNNNTYSQAITATGAGNLKFIPSSDFDGSIDDVSVKEAASTLDIFQPGHVGSYWRLKLSNGTDEKWGYVKITGYISRIEVQAEVQKSLVTQGGVQTTTTTAFGDTAVSVGGIAEKTLSTTDVLHGTTPTKIWREGAWSEVRGYPACCIFYEERLIFAGSRSQPQTIWGSASGDFENFTPEETITDGGPITYTLASNQVNIIKWLASDRVLMAGTGAGEWRISASSESQPLTPTNITARMDTAKGSADVPPQPVGDGVLFVQRHGRKLRELAYLFERDRYVAPDLTILSEHITKPSLISLAYQKEPDQRIWAVRSDGVAAVMTYEREQQVMAWSRRGTDGLFEDINTIPGTKQTEVWAMVQRTIGGQTKRYIECFQDEEWEDRLETETYFTPAQRQLVNAFFVDSGLTYDGEPKTLISGLEHLAGETVKVLADGSVHPDCLVSTAGQITLERQARVVHAGLGYTGILKTLRPEVQSKDGTAQGKTKRVNKMGIRLIKSRGGSVGPDLNHLEPLIYREVADDWEAPPPLLGVEEAEDLVANYQGSYEPTGQVTIIHEEPLPFTVAAVMPRFSVADN